MNDKNQDELDSIPVIREQENENDFYSLQTSESIEITTSKSRKSILETRFKIIDKILYSLFILAFILLLIQFIMLLTEGEQNEENKIPNLTSGQETKTNIETKPEIEKKLNIGFLYPSLSGNGISRFMQVTSENFLRYGNYNVIFITKKRQKNELSFNPKIKRYFCFSNMTLIKEVIKQEKIDFLLVNNYFSPNIVSIKTTGAKIIGLYHGVFFSSMFNNDTLLYHDWKNLKLYDAFVHLSIDDYYFMSNLGFQNNIFIPNMYTFDKDKTPLAELKNHNIMMLGRLNDRKKGVIFAVKAMEIIVKEIPDAKLNLVSSDSKDERMEQIIKKLNLSNNIKYIPFTQNIQKYFLDSSVFFFPSLTEAFPMALNEAKAYGLPCVGFNVDYSVPYKTGIIKVEMFDYKALANEVIKLLKDYDYRIKVGKEAKESLSMFSNEETTKMWTRLFYALNSDEIKFQRLRKAIKKKYYNKLSAKKNLEKQFNYIKQYNKFFKCYTLDNFTDVDRINNITLCQNVTF